MACMLRWNLGVNDSNFGHASDGFGLLNHCFSHQRVCLLGRSGIDCADDQERKDYE